MLRRRPLGYRVARQTGSHRRLVSSRYPPLSFAFRDRQTIRPSSVRRILVEDVGLSEPEALELL